MTSTPLLVIFVDWFEPAYKAGGPIRSVSNLSRLLGQDAEIRIFTSNRDHGDTEPLQGVQTDCWIDFAPNVRVWYSSDSAYSLMIREFKSLQPNTVYFNSLFSIPYFLRPLIISLSAFPDCRKVIAPRGMLHQGALQYGTAKKKLFLRLLKLMRWSEKLVWQATDVQERQDIRTHIGKSCEIRDAGNVPTIVPDREHVFRSKSPNTLKTLFVSRVQPKKNLLFLLTLLADYPNELSLDIIGPIEDESYWTDCQQQIDQLPANIQVKYLGAMPHAKILERQQDYDLFVLPTFGENFGHSIYDALAGGLPVMISDQTPWRELEKTNCGMDLPLASSAWLQGLESFHRYSPEEWEEKRISASKFARQYIYSQDFTNQYHQLFFQA